MAFDLQTQLAKFLADLYAGVLGVTQALTSVSIGTNPAAAGSVRVPNGINAVVARNAANNGDVQLVYVDGSNFVNVGSNGGFYVDGVGTIRGIHAVSTAGLTGVPAVYAATEVTAQSAANASIATVTNGSADGTYEVSGNMNVTASTTLATTLTCTYTDEASTARSMILPIAPLSGTFTAAGAITGAGATVWHTPVMTIRVKASTVITILTSAGTFTGVTYTARGIIKQVA